MTQQKIRREKAHESDTHWFTPHKSLHPEDLEQTASSSLRLHQVGLENLCFLGVFHHFQFFVFFLILLSYFKSSDLSFPYLHCPLPPPPHPLLCLSQEKSRPPRDIKLCITTTRPFHPFTLSDFSSGSGGGELLGSEQRRDLMEKPHLGLNVSSSLIICIRSSCACLYFIFITKITSYLNISLYEFLLTLSIILKKNQF